MDDRIHGFTHRLYHNPLPADAAELYTTAKALGADLVALVPHHYGYVDYSNPTVGPRWAPAPPEYHAPPPGWIYEDVGQDPYHPFANTTSPDTVYHLAHLAEEIGLRVMLKPHLDPRDPDAWRGQVSTGYPAVGSKGWRQWRTSYRSMLERYVRIAKTLHDPILCMGCELYALTKELGAGWWCDMAQWLRSRSGAHYTGPLTYAANWGIADDAEYNRVNLLWGLMDYVGVDAYFPLCQGNSYPTLTELVAGWDERTLPRVEWAPRIAEDLIRCATASGKPLLFTELGYPNMRRAHLDPAGGPKPGDIRDDYLQATLYQAAWQRWEQVPPEVWAGMVAWEMYTPAEAEKEPISHSITSRLAGTVAFGKGVAS